MPNDQKAEAPVTYNFTFNGEETIMIYKMLQESPMPYKISNPMITYMGSQINAQNAERDKLKKKIEEEEKNKQKEPPADELAK